MVWFGAFSCDVAVNLGVLSFSFFPGLRQRKHKKGKKREKKTNPSSGCPTLSKHRFASTPFKFLSGAFFPFLGGYSQSCLSPSTLSSSSTNPLPGCSCSGSTELWDQPGAAGAWAGLCCVLSSHCKQLPDGFSSHLPARRRAQCSAPPWPGTASLNRTAQGQTNHPVALGS